MHTKFGTHTHLFKCENTHTHIHTHPYLNAVFIFIHVMYIYTLFHTHNMYRVAKTQGCLKLQASFRQRAPNYWALLRKLTYTDKASYESSPICTRTQKAKINGDLSIQSQLITHTAAHSATHTLKTNKNIHVHRLKKTITSARKNSWKHFQPNATTLTENFRRKARAN